MYGVRVLDDTRRALPRIALLFVAAFACVADGGSQAADHTVDFDIRPQPLARALLEFGRQAGVSIGFPDDPRLDRDSPGLRGRTTPRQALERLLEGTSLEYTFHSGSTIAISLASPGDAASKTAAPPAARGPEPAVVAKAAGDTPKTDPFRQSYVDEIVAVGSQIRNARIAGMMPVTILDKARLADVGPVSGDDLFRSLASAGMVTFNGIDNYFYGVNDARGDVSSINLRSLGSHNTLMLLNGRRMVAHPGSQEEQRVLTTTVNGNSLPVNAIERVEVLRDGASPIYGSEAVGGVVNSVLAQRAAGVRAELRYGEAADSALSDTILSIEAGAAVGKHGYVSAFASYLKRTGMPSRDRRYARSSDLRSLFSGTPFEDDADVLNTSNSSAWGQFKLPQAVAVDGRPITSETGVFHIQPAAWADCLAALPDSVCIDEGRIDTELRHDNNQDRYLVPDLERSNLFLLWSRALNGAELYGELGWYEAKSHVSREGSSPLSSHPITIPANNYWNPFGPEFFSDGRPNPNRLPGIDAPPEGLPIQIDTRVLGGFYRVVDAGPREVVVNNESRRVLLGLSGERNGWEWDTAILYSDAETADTTYNRISSTAFQAALARETKDAYNPFNGGDPERSSYGDATRNARAIIEPFLIDVERHNRTSLALADLHLSKAELVELPAGRLALAVGAELRRERYAEDRDPRLDGTIGYTDTVSGIAYESDVMESSMTPDSSGSRTVRSLFAELALPVVDESMAVPFVRNLDLQLAVRYEHFSDVGGQDTPKLALSWELVPWLQLRASYSEGFRAPNLPQINTEAVPRLQVVRDWYRCRALLNKGLIPTLGGCVLEDVRAVEVVTSGSSALDAEKGRSTSVGIVLRPIEDGDLVLTADYWRITQDGVVGLFGEQNHVALDYYRRLQGAHNPAVIRAPVTAQDIELFEGSGLEAVGLLDTVHDRYLNLDARVTRGLDLAMFYTPDETAAGTFQFRLEAARLIEAHQKLSALDRALAELDEPAVQIIGAGSLLEHNDRPKWRGAVGVDWRRGPYGGGVWANYIGAVKDTSAIQDLTQEFLRVDAWTTTNARFEYHFQSDRWPDLRLRIGVRNLMDRDPPVADEALGYMVGLHDSLGRYLYLSLQSAL